MCLHISGCLTGKYKVIQKIQIQHFLGFLHFKVQNGLKHGNSGIIYKQIQSAQFPDSLVKKLLPFSCLCHISLCIPGKGTHISYFFSCFLCLIFSCPIGKGNIISGCCQFSDNSTSNSTTGTCNDCFFSHHSFPLLFYFPRQYLHRYGNFHKHPLISQFSL